MLIEIILFLIPGIMFVAIMGFNVLNKIRCNKKIEGQCLGIVIQKHTKAGSTYRIKISYEVDGKVYINTPLDNLRKSCLKKLYKKGTRVYIYINPKDPNKFVLRREICLANIVLFIIGIVFIFIAFSIINV